jgi:hypothetical protein
LVAGPYQEVRLRVVVDDQAEAEITFINELPDCLATPLATSNNRSINKQEVMIEKAGNYVKFGIFYDL